MTPCYMEVISECEQSHFVHVGDGSLGLGCFVQIVVIFVDLPL